MVSSNGSQKKARSSTKMYPLIQSWEESGQSQKEFCVERGVKLHVFWYWLRRYREERQRSEEASKGFIAVKVEGSVEESVLAEIIYPDGTRAVFKERVGVKFLKSLLPKRE